MACTSVTMVSVPGVRPRPLLTQTATRQGVPIVCRARLGLGLPSRSTNTDFMRAVAKSTAPCRRAAGVLGTAMTSDADEKVFFDGGPHFGDMVVNILFGLTALWLPLTLAAIARGLLARYRFTDKRVTIVAGLSGEDRKDFAYKDITNVVSVARFLGDWGDVVITLRNGDKMELRSLPKFRKVVEYIDVQRKAANEGRGSSAVVSRSSAKGF